MSNKITYEELLNRTLNRVSSSVDTSEGSFLFDAIAPCVAELYEAYLYIDELDVDLRIICPQKTQFFAKVNHLSNIKGVSHCVNYISHWLTPKLF
ncbi:hypothetical protein [Cellulosilyticum ruminicola]|uniref:hypothetical protein n=1 Tax=Cellulosilyticum ruminicola TaxID=425254 RepID=UPI0006CF4789|nr:hypothetical protein [Cellulosilyticum ruminicola]